MDIFVTNGTFTYPEEELKRGHHIWIKSITYSFVVYGEPVNGTIVESVAEVLPLDEKKEQRNV